MDNNEKINSIIGNLRKKYQQEYGVAVFNIDFKNTGAGIELSGKVLTESQRDDIINALKKSKKNIIKENIKVLADAKKRNEIGWAVVKSVGIGFKSVPINLKSRFVSNKILNEKILKRIRCSQAFKGEILRVLRKNEDQLLVQQSDLSLGWVNSNEVVLKRASSSPDKGRLGGVKKRRRLDLYKEWRKGNFAIKGKIVSLSACHSEFSSESVTDFEKDDPMQTNQKISEIRAKLDVNQKKILKQVQDDKIRFRITEEAEKYIGAKYVLGGKSENGIDCSGLVQVAYKNAFDIILPRHSWDQKKMGEKVNLENIKTGDLVFLIKKNNQHKHVGIVERASESLPETLTGRKISLIHASLDKKKVVKQDLDEVFDSYEFVEARRILE